MKKGVHLGCKFTFSQIIQDLEGVFFGCGICTRFRKTQNFLKGCGIPQNLRSGCGIGKENGIRDDKDDRSSGCGIAVTSKDPPFQTLTITHF